MDKLEKEIQSILEGSEEQVPFTMEKVATLPEVFIKGRIYFIESTGELHVGISETETRCFSGVLDVEYDNHQLTVFRANKEPITINFTDLYEALSNLNTKIDTEIDSLNNEIITETNRAKEEEQSIKNIIGSGFSSNSTVSDQLQTVKESSKNIETLLEWKNTNVSETDPITGRFIITDSNDFKNNYSSTISEEGYFGKFHKDSVVFIEDSKTIWTNGQFYNTNKVYYKIFPKSGQAKLGDILISTSNIPYLILGNKYLGDNTNLITLLGGSQPNNDSYKPIIIDRYYEDDNYIANIDETEGSFVLLESDFTNTSVTSKILENLQTTNPTVINSNDTILTALSKLQAQITSNLGQIPAASDEIPLISLGPGNTGTSNKYARADHVHPEQINITGNAATSTIADTIKEKPAIHTGVQGNTIQIEVGGKSSPDFIVPYAYKTSGFTTARTISLIGHVTGELSTTFEPSTATIETTVVNDSHSHSNSTITSLDATKITSGILSVDRLPSIPIEKLPKGALERLVIVENKAARLALTTNQIQEGDTVKEEDTGYMYFVVDSTKLNSEAGYSIYTAAAATSVPWSGIINKPNSFTPSSHKHPISDISDLNSTWNTFLKGNVYVRKLKMNGLEAGFLSSAASTVFGPFVAPTSWGNLGQILESAGTTAPKWINKPIQMTRWPSISEVTDLPISSAINFGGNANEITTAQLIEWLKTQSTLLASHKIGSYRGKWSYSYNQVLVTNIGKIHLAGAWVEFILNNNTGHTTIRITTPTTNNITDKSSLNRTYVYTNNGDNYKPGWHAYARMDEIPGYNKISNFDFSNFPSQAFGSNDSVKTFRHESGVENLIAQYGAGLAWKTRDTWASLGVNYESKQIIVNGGNMGNGSYWHGEIAFKGSISGSDITSGSISIDRIPNLPTSKITALTGYSKPSTSSALTASDSLNSALGKLEKKFDSYPLSSNLTWNNISGKPSSFTPSNHDHAILSGWSDTRDTVTTPNTYNYRLQCLGIKTKTSLNIKSGDSNLCQVLGYRGWFDYNGGMAHEFALATEHIWYRKGNTSWNDWEYLITNNDLTWNNILFKPTTVDGYGITDVIKNNATVVATTLPAGSSATVSYDKTTNKFTFGIPRGNTGSTGATGPKGDPGPISNLTFATLTSNTIVAGKVYYNTSAKTISTYSGFSLSNPDAVIYSTAKITFSGTCRKLSNLADLSGSYYIYCLSYMPTSSSAGIVCINGAVYTT